MSVKMERLEGIAMRHMDRATQNSMRSGKAAKERLMKEAMGEKKQESSGKKREKHSIGAPVGMPYKPPMQPGMTGNNPAVYGSQTQNPNSEGYGNGPGLAVMRQKAKEASQRGVAGMGNPLSYMNPQEYADFQQNRNEQMKRSSAPPSPSPISPTLGKVGGLDAWKQQAQSASQRGVMGLGNPQSFANPQEYSEYRNLPHNQINQNSMAQNPEGYGNGPGLDAWKQQAQGASQRGVMGLGNPQSFMNPQEYANYMQNKNNQ